MKRLNILTTCTFKMKLRSMFYEPRQFNLISAFRDFNGKPNYCVTEKKNPFSSALIIKHKHIPLSHMMYPTFSIPVH